MSYFCKNVDIGDAGIPRNKRKKYKKTLCFLVEGDKFVDIHVTKSQLKRLQRILKDEPEALEEKNIMKKYTFSARVTVSAVTIVYTDGSEEEAREIAEEREPIIDEHGQFASEYWSVQEADGTPQSIELEEIEEV